MIISHKHKFIYWKSYKTASTSVMSGLGKYCDGVSDVVGSLNWDGDDWARVDELDRNGNLVVKKFKDYGRNLFKSDGTRIFRDNHTLPFDIKNYVGGEIWNEYFKFTIVRNPWDRCVSSYFFIKRGGPSLDHPLVNKKNLSINDFIVQNINENMYVDSDGTLYADFHIRYENLQTDYDFVCKKVGISQHELPKLRTTFRNDNETYQNLYKTQTQIDMVRKSHKHDIEYFGYEFEKPMKKLLCVYTHIDDTEMLSQFKNTSLYKKAFQNPNIEVIEVYAGAPTTKYFDGKLFLSCKESYTELSVKTYKMIKHCVSDFEFDVLVKVDASICGYGDREIVGTYTKEIRNFLYNLDRVENALFSDEWFRQHGDYGGVHLSTRGTHRGIEGWAIAKGVEIDFNAEFFENADPFFMGKFYFMSRDFCKFVAENGKELAIRHVKNLGGSEDSFVGRMFSKYNHGDWLDKRHQWINDTLGELFESKLPTKTKLNLIRFMGSAVKAERKSLTDWEHNARHCITAPLFDEESFNPEHIKRSLAQKDTEKIFAETAIMIDPSVHKVL